MLVGVGLAALSVGFFRGSFLFVDFSRSNVCERRNSTRCFEHERGVIDSGDGSRELEVIPVGGERERVVAYDSWEETPPAGAQVVLERWEGDEIAFVYVPASGSRYKAQGAPDRENPFVFALIFAALAVVLPMAIVMGR